MKHTSHLHGAVTKFRPIKGVTKPHCVGEQREMCKDSSDSRALCHDGAWWTETNSTRCTQRSYRGAAKFQLSSSSTEAALTLWTMSGLHELRTPVTIALTGVQHLQSAVTVPQKMCLRSTLFTSQEVHKHRFVQPYL